MVDENVSLNLTTEPSLATESLAQHFCYPLDRPCAYSLQVADVIDSFPITKLATNISAIEQNDKLTQLQQDPSLSANLTVTLTIQGVFPDEDGRLQYRVSYEQDRTQNMDIDENPNAYFYGEVELGPEDFLNEATGA